MFLYPVITPLRENRSRKEESDMERGADKFFLGGGWSEVASQQHLVAEAKLEWEKSNAPWQSAMRGWLSNGAKFPTPMLRFDVRACALAIYCRGRAFEREHGFSPCQICPYGCGNFELFKELSHVFAELRIGEWYQQRGDNE